MGRVHRSILLRRERLKKYQADKRQRAMRPPSPPLPPEELEVKLEFGEIPGMDLDFESLPEINTADNNLSPEPAPEQWSPPVGKKFFSNFRILRSSLSKFKVTNSKYAKYLHFRQNLI